MLHQLGRFNDFTSEFLDELQKHVSELGPIVRYKFDIANDDPHPDNRGKKVFPFKYTLDPCTFEVIDKYEKRQGKQKLKYVSMPMIESVDDKGNPTRFHKIVVHERNNGVLQFDLSSHDDVAMVMYLELHPKNKNGLYPDRTKVAKLERIDEKNLSKKRREERSKKLEAFAIAEKMSEAEIIQFANAMMWDTTKNIDVLRNEVEEMAETDPVFFTDIVSSKSIEYQDVIKTALDNRVISFDPVNYKFLWTSNNQVLAIVMPNENKNHVQLLADYFISGGDKAEDAYKKMKSFLKKEKVA